MIDELRRENLQTLVEEFGSVTALANALDRSDSQVSQWLNGSMHSETGKQRGMRKESARYIEERCGKPMGWLDQDHRSIGPATISSLGLPIFAIKCSKCGQVSHKSFIQLEMNDTVTCDSCEASITVADYYSVSVLETILQGFGGTGFTLRKR